MPRIQIDNQQADVPPGATVVQAAEAMGIAIPTLCYHPELEATGSCRVCLVRRRDTGQMVPACVTVAEEGPGYDSQTDDVLAARRAALELLLGDHLGDCEAPCRLACPAGVDIPRVLRLVLDSRWREAIVLIKRDLPLPGSICARCDAPCEKACRRGQIDRPIAIHGVIRRVAEANLKSLRPYVPLPAEPTGKTVGIIGSGPAGLTAAYLLQSRGLACTVYDSAPAPGGSLRDDVTAGRLCQPVLDGEIKPLREMGVTFRLDHPVGGDTSLDALRAEFDAIILAIGPVDASAGVPEGTPLADGAIAVDRATLACDRPGVFAAGRSVRPGATLLRAAADGRTVARSVGQALSGGPVSAPPRRLNVHIGRLRDREKAEVLKEAAHPREGVSDEVAGELDEASAIAEAGRCLHCDCRKADACKLRREGEACGASPSAWSRERRSFTQDRTHPDVIYEPGKCIACGLCVQVADRAGDGAGLTLRGRGFDVRMSPPLGKTLAEAIGDCALHCAAVCPTAALSPRRDEP